MNYHAYPYTSAAGMGDRRMGVDVHAYLTYSTAAANVLLAMCESESEMCADICV